VNLLTPAQVAELSQLSEATILRLARTGQIPGAKKVGGSWRIVESRFQAWLETDDEAKVEEPSEPRHLATTTEGGRW
jgi:excisionase family DNA binding protein